MLKTFQIIFFTDQIIIQESLYLDLDEIKEYWLKCF